MPRSDVLDLFMPPDPEAEAIRRLMGPSGILYGAIPQQGGILKSKKPGSAVTTPPQSGGERGQALQGMVQPGKSGPTNLMSQKHPGCEKGHTSQNKAQTAHVRSLVPDNNTPQNHTSAGTEKETNPPLMLTLKCNPPSTKRKTPPTTATQPDRTKMETEREELIDKVRRTQEMVTNVETRMKEIEEDHAIAIADLRSEHDHELFKRDVEIARLEKCVQGNEYIQEREMTRKDEILRMQVEGLVRDHARMGEKLAKIKAAMSTFDN